MLKLKWKLKEGRICTLYILDIPMYIISLDGWKMLEGPTKNLPIKLIGRNEFLPITSDFWPIIDRWSAVIINPDYAHLWPYAKSKKTNEENLRKWPKSSIYGFFQTYEKSEQSYYGKYDNLWTN